MDKKLKNDFKEECQEEKITALEEKLVHMENELKLVKVELEYEKEARTRDKINFETEKCELEFQLDKYKEKCTAFQSENERLQKYVQKFESTNIIVQEKSQINLCSTDLTNQLKKIMESANETLNINSLPDEMLINIFSYLSQKNLGKIARVCRRWNVLTRNPVLWKDYVTFMAPCRSQTTAAKSFVNMLPSCVTNIKLDFGKDDWSENLNFEELSVTFQERCPHLEKLFFDHALLLNNLPSVIDLCTKLLQDLKILIFSNAEFHIYPERGEFTGISQIEVLFLDRCTLYGHLNMFPFSQMPHLKKLFLFGTNVSHSWFQDHIFSLNQLHLLYLGYSNIDSRTFHAIQSHVPNLKELHLCGTNLKDNDLNFNNTTFPHLETICLAHCFVTCEGVVSLVQSCHSLKNVYVYYDLATLYTEHPFINVYKCKLGIVKGIFSCDHKLRRAYLKE